MTKVCAGTDLPLVPGEKCYSVLIEQNGTYERLDFSQQGWKGLPENAVGCWLSVVPVPQTQQAATADPESLMQFFEQLAEAPNARQERLAYVLALYLLQRRRLKLDGSRVDGELEYLQLSGSRGEGPFEIRDQQLSEDEVNELRAALDQQLNQGWETAA